MKIVIAGAGEVGSHLAKLLSNENQEITVIDNDETRFSRLERLDLWTVKDSPTSFKALRSKCNSDTDLFIAVTPYETDNVVACEIAKHLGVKRTVARIDNYQFMLESEYFKSRGINSLIYPEYLAAEEMLTALKHNWVRNWFELYDGELLIIGVKVRENAQILGKPLKDLFNLSTNAHISAIRRKTGTIIPGGNDVIKANDIVYIATTKANVNNLIGLCGKELVNIKKVLVVGGSRIAVQLAKLAENCKDIQLNLTIVEVDFNKSNYLMERLSNCKVVHSDGRNFETLEENDVYVSDFDAFISLTDSSEMNILGCLAAKAQGVKKTIAEVENINFIAEAEALNIGTVINKKLLASSNIFQLLLDSDAGNSKCLALTDAEVAEVVAKANSKITKDKVKNLKLSSDFTIAGLIRDGKGSLVQGDTQIMAGDHVVVFCLSGSLHKVEKLFK